MVLRCCGVVVCLKGRASRCSRPAFSPRSTASHAHWSLTSASPHAPAGTRPPRSLQRTRAVGPAIPPRTRRSDPEPRRRCRAVAASRDGRPAGWGVGICGGGGAGRGEGKPRAKKRGAARGLLACTLTARRRPPGPRPAYTHAKPPDATKLWISIWGERCRGGGAGGGQGQRAQQHRAVGRRWWWCQGRRALRLAPRRSPRRSDPRRREGRWGRGTAGCRAPRSPTRGRGACWRAQSGCCRRRTLRSDRLGARETPRRTWRKTE